MSGIISFEVRRAITKRHPKGGCPCVTCVRSPEQGGGCLGDQIKPGAQFCAKYSPASDTLPKDKRKKTSE